MRVPVDVTDTGDRSGNEVVQVYVRVVDAPVIRRVIDRWSGATGSSMRSSRTTR